MKILHKSAVMNFLAAAGLATALVLAGGAVAQQDPQSERPAKDAVESRPDRKEIAGDPWITAKVKAALLADADVRGLALDVDTKDGVVALRGTAVTQAEIDAAKKIALGIEGVRDVDVRQVVVGTKR